MRNNNRHVLYPPCPAAAVNLCHFSSRCFSSSAAWAAFSAYCFWQSSNKSASISRNILRTFTVSPWTAWFQWPLIFFSRASKIMGKITFRFWAIKLTTCSLFHKNKARSATWKIQIYFKDISKRFNLPSHSPGSSLDEIKKNWNNLGTFKTSEVLIENNIRYFHYSTTIYSLHFRLYYIWLGTKFKKETFRTYGFKHATKDKIDV